MLRLCRIEISNFACFDHLVVEPSTDPDRPLTVIRAENGSGKTTFLRALRWGMYSERGLPGDAKRFSLHPASWTPDGDGIRTEVSIEFETDGSTRFDQQAGSTTKRYLLTRSVTTIARPAANDNEPDFRRINDQARLMVKEDGVWAPHNAGVDLVIEELLPWDLRDFFVMDADEATDFVGGSENKTVSRADVTAKTTGAVRSLLGIDVFKKASQRLAGLSREFGAQATKAIGDSDLDDLQQELDQLREEHDQRTHKLAEDRSLLSEHSDRRARRQDDLENELKGLGAADELRQRLQANQREVERAKRARLAAVSQLGRELESPRLLATLSSLPLRRAFNELKPLYDAGHIPLKHVGFVRGLLESGTCVCGEDLSSDGIHRRHVEDQLTRSQQEEERANYLGQLHDAAKSLVSFVGTPLWPETRTRLTRDLIDEQNALSAAEIDERDIQAKLDAIDHEHIQVIREELATLDQLIADLTSTISREEPAIEQLASRIDSLQKQVHQRQRNERAAGDHREAEALAELARLTIERAYGTIQREQVKELSQEMNRLFAQMVTNVSDSDFEDGEGGKANLRMIAEVGVRPTESDPEQFEIYALNQRGRAMPPIEINGASRRVLALSFVLALCRESRTFAPLVADSLLNFMSGAVRRNTLRATATNSSQPILLLTGADLDAASEIETTTQYAGKTYTLTGQWDAIDAGGGGDVVNWTTQRQVSEACECGPREYCDVCERAGWAGTPGWTKRT